MAQPLPLFKLECPDIELIKPIIAKLGPGGIICGDLAVFDLVSPNLEDSVEAVSALAAHSFEYGRRFNKSETTSVMNFLWCMTQG